MKPSWKLELVIYGIFCALSATAIIPSLKYGLGSIGELGPGLLPFATSLCALVLGLVLFFTTLARKSKSAPQADMGRIDRGGWVRVGGILASLAVWPLLVNMIGYIISTFVVSLGMGKTIGYEGWLKPIILSACVAGSIWFVFGFMFSVDLPAGLSF